MVWLTARVGLIGRALALISPTRPAIEFKPFLQKPDDPSWSRFWACDFKINHQVKPWKTGRRSRLVDVMQRRQSQQTEKSRITSRSENVNDRCKPTSASASATLFDCSRELGPSSARRQQSTFLKQPTPAASFHNQQRIFTSFSLLVNFRLQIYFPTVPHPFIYNRRGGKLTIVLLSIDSNNHMTFMSLLKNNSCSLLLKSVNRISSSISPRTIRAVV
ncbi:Squalene--hopene cyclase [Trichinella spiralis]|uniref:Squalene--hopene cyclase n=2 Tax=Trichinella spiralis TaxID=6334 RepID=A0ABR3KTF3_TRISP